MKVVVVGAILLVGVPVAVFGVALILNMRNVGVRYIRWRRSKAAARGRRGLARLDTPRGTRLVAAWYGLVWLAFDGGVVAVVVHGLLS